MDGPLYCYLEEISLDRDLSGVGTASNDALSRNLPIRGNKGRWGARHC